MSEVRGQGGYKSGMTPIIALECKVRTRFWASLDGWPGTFRPSGFKQTQIPFVMAIPVGPFPSPKTHSQKSHGRMAAAFNRL